MERVNYSEDSAEPIPQPQEQLRQFGMAVPPDYSWAGQVQQAETEAFEELGDRAQQRSKHDSIDEEVHGGKRL